MMPSLVDRELENCWRRHKSGDGGAIIDAIYFCAGSMCRWPDWLADEVEKEIRTSKKSRLRRRFGEIGADSASRHLTQKRRFAETLWHIVRGIQDGRKELGVKYKDEGFEDALQIAAIVCNLPYDTVRGHYKNTNRRISKVEALYRFRHPVYGRIIELIVDNGTIDPRRWPTRGGGKI